MAAMSGAIESSVAAGLLREQGYEVCGVTLRFFGSDELGLYGNSESPAAALEDARTAAMGMELNHYVFNFGMAFHSDVIVRFTRGYVNGVTPNACIYCKRYITFQKLLDRATLMGFDYLVTGHYAIIDRDTGTGRYLLKRAKDKCKDQSYMLYFMNQHQLANCLFPLGKLTGKEVRELADSRYCPDSLRRDGKEICFVRDGDMGRFMEQTMGIRCRSGDFVDRMGSVLGRHRGIISYTVGQEVSSEIGSAHPRYVIDKSVSDNTVTLGSDEDLLCIAVIVEDTNFIPMDSLSEPMEVTVQTAYRGLEEEASISPMEDGRVKVLFKMPHRGAVPGQAAVFYCGEVIIGGGTILETL